ncbi:MAG: hypothetical protein QF530_09040 [SAR202 cluster bacterium]|jgi:hypothetical protein|nr:hypothetical protein [SAR202 cluster bacterium]
MPDQTLLDKLMISKSTRLLVISAPHGYIDKITPLEEGVILSTVGELAAGKPYDFVQIFVRNRLDVMELAPAAPAVLSDDGALWLSYPRRSPNLETDIDSNRGWETLLNAGWTAVSEISIDETWSAIRFVLNPDA